MRLHFGVDDLVDSLDPHTAKVCKVTKYSRQTAIVDYFVDALPEWFEVELGYNDVRVGDNGTYIEVEIFADDKDIDRDEIVKFVHGCFQDAADFMYDTQFHDEDGGDDEDDEDENGWNHYHADWHDEDSIFEDDREDNPAGQYANRRAIRIDTGAAASLLMDHGHYDLAMKVRRLKEFRKTEDQKRLAMKIVSQLLSRHYDIGLPKKAINFKVTSPDTVTGTLDFPGEHKTTSFYEQTRNEMIDSWLRSGVTGAAQEFFAEGRSDNPSSSGLPLGSLALGAALGAVAMHFTMKPKQ